MVWYDSPATPVYAVQALSKQLKFSSVTNTVLIDLMMSTVPVVIFSVLYLHKFILVAVAIAFIVANCAVALLRSDSSCYFWCPPVSLSK